MDGENDLPPPKKEEPALTLVERIKNKQLNPTLLTPDERRECVQLLKLQHWNQNQMARFLDCSDKTIRRDLKKIRQENSTIPSSEILKETFGEALENIRADIEALKKIADSQGSSTREKIQARYAAAKMTISWMKTLESLGLNNLKTFEDLFGNS